MSFTDRLMLWFHVAFAVFTIGPVTAATMSSPRAIRTRNVPVLRYLTLTTVIFGAASLGVPAFGMSVGQSLGELGQAWLTVAITLYVVALVLLVIIVRDQRRAISALEAAAEQETAGVATPATGEEGDAPEPGTGQADSTGDAPAAGAGNAPNLPVASVERGRIASISGLVALIWVAILVLMVWNS